MEKMRARKGSKGNRLEARRSAPNVTRSDRNDGSLRRQHRDVLIATLTELHGRSSEVARRMMDDARLLADIQRETSAVLLKLWNLGFEPSHTAPASSATSTPSDNQPRFLRFPEVAERIGLSRSSVWRMERAGQFPQHRRLSSNTVGWWEPEIEEWLRTRGER
jgi:predicted DNA-binding transcriptional regulator AlpA